MGGESGGPGASTAGVRIQVVGGVHLVGRSDRSVLSGRLAQVVAILAWRCGQVVTTDALVDQVWASPPASARSALRNLIARLRRELDALDVAPSVLQSSGAGYQLRLDRNAVDVHVAEQEVVVGRARVVEREWEPLLGSATTAVQLLSGEPYPDVDSPQIDIERRRLHLIEREARMQLVTALRETGQLEAAVLEGHELIERDPFDEEVVATVMRALQTLGRSAEAIRLAAGLRGRLGGAGLEPSPSLGALEGRILRHDRGDGPPTRSSASTGVSFVGRQRELRQARRALEDGPSALVAVVGDAGIGKSRFVEQLAAQWRRDGGDTVRATCPRNCSPFEPWRTIASELGQDVDRVFASGSDRVTVIHRLATMVSTMSDGPTMIVFDDAHWFDLDSLESLLRLRDLAADRVAFVVAMRTGPASVDRVRSTLLADLVRAATTIGLGPLHDDDARALAVAALAPGRSDAPQARVDDICRRARGVPLYLVELARADGDVANGLSVEVGLRLESVDDDTRALVSAAAVLGRAAELSVLAAAAGLGPDAARRSTARARGVGFVHDRPDGLVELRHPLVAEFIVDTIPELERARISVELLERSPAHTTAAAVDLIDDALPVLEPGRAAELLVAAARQSLRSAALDGAAGFASRAIDVIEARCPTRRELLAEALLVLGDATMWRDEQAGRDALDRAADLAWDLRMPAVLVAAASSLGGRRLDSDRVWPSRLRSAIEWLGPDQSGLRACLQAELSLLTVETEGGPEPVELGRRALAAAEAAGDRHVVMTALHARILSGRIDLGPEQRFELCGRLRHHARIAGNDRVALQADMLSLLDLLELGRLPEVADRAVALRREAQRLGWRRHEAYSLVIEASVAEALGDDETFNDRSTRGREVGHAGQLADADGIFAAQTVVGVLHADRLGELLPLIEQVLPSYAGVPIWRSVHAAALAQSGARERATAELGQLTGRRFEDHPHGLLHLATVAFCALAAFWADDEVAGRRSHDALVPHAGRYVVPGFGLGVLGPVETFLGAAAAAAGDRRLAGRWFTTAIASADGAGFTTLARFAKQLDQGEQNHGG